MTTGVGASVKSLFLPELEPEGPAAPHAVRQCVYLSVGPCVGPCVSVRGSSCSCARRRPQLIPANTKTDRDRQRDRSARLSVRPQRCERPQQRGEEAASPGAAEQCAAEEGGRGRPLLKGQQPGRGGGGGADGAQQPRLVQLRAYSVT